MNAQTDPTPNGFDSSASLNLEVYSELKKLAVRRMANRLNNVTLQPTVLVHEAWLRLSANSEKWKDQNHFLATAAVTMRHILIDNARRKARLRHGQGLARTGTGWLNSLPEPGADEEILLIDEGVRELEKEQPLRAQIVTARFFGGLSNKEVADSLGIGERSVERHWSAAKVWLYRWMQSMKRR